MFCAHVQKILDEMAALKDRFNNPAPKRASRSLVIGGTYGVSSDLLPSVASQFKKSHPNVQVTVRARASSNIQEQILAGKIEIGVIARWPTHSRLQAEPFSTRRLAPCWRRNPSLCRKSRCDPFRAGKHTVGSARRFTIARHGGNYFARARL